MYGLCWAFVKYVYQQQTVTLREICIQVDGLWTVRPHCWFRFEELLWNNKVGSIFDISAVRPLVYYDPV